MQHTRHFYFMPLFACMLAACHFISIKNREANVLTISVGKGAASVEAGDFNGDGKPDIAVASLADSSIAILLNQGNRQFVKATGSPFYAGHMPNDLCIADLNKDGNADIAVANHEKKYFTVLLGNGKGGFSPAPQSPFAVNVTPHTHGIIAADFNGDGYPDVATDSWAVDSVVILTGDGKGNFTNPKYFATGKHPYQRLRTADLNHDGYSDIVTSNLDGNTVTLLLGDGKGNFSSRAVEAGIVPFGVAIGDLNADGNPDLAVINSPTISGGKSGADGLTILLGDGKGNMAKLKGSPFETGLGPTRVAIGDLNHDGINDVAVAHYNSPFVNVYYLNKTGLAATAQFPVGMGAEGLAISDLDGDGKMDLLCSSSVGNELRIFFGK